MNNRDNNHLFSLCTSKTKPVKDLFELLHDLINEGNLECSKEGIRLLNINRGGNFILHLRLYENSFEHYSCDERPIVLGLNLEEIFKIIKLVENNETLTLFVPNDDIDRLSIQRFNIEEKIINTKSLALYDIATEVINIPDIEFDNVIVMPAQRFQKICREYYQFSDTVEIVSCDNTIYFKSSGDRVKQELSISETEDGVAFEKQGNKNSIFRGNFNLKYLVKFAKCANLCTNISIHLKNDCPLIIECNMEDFGLIRLCISETIDDSNIDN